jgi:sugar lactone lactonase YvrE
MIKQTILFLLAAVVLYLAFAPISIDPVAWTPPVNPGFTGAYAPNDRLATIEKKAEGICAECEDVAVDTNGQIYGGAANGDILVFNADFSTHKVLANTDGRPLGLAIDNKTNYLYVADAIKGLLEVRPDGTIHVLTDSYEGRRLVLTDDLALTPDSTILFTEASYKMPLGTYKLDLMEHRPNGFLFEYDYKTGKTNVLLDSLYFPNGVAVSADGSYALFSNMGKYQILKYNLKGAQKGQLSVFADNLPGFADGVNIGPDGTVWLSMVSPRLAIMENLMPHPTLRKVVARLPAFLQPAPARYGFILGLDANGAVKYNLQDPTGRYAGITNCVPHGDYLLLGSLLEHSIGLYKL